MLHTAITRGFLRLAIAVLPAAAGAQTHCPDRSDLAVSGIAMVQTAPYYLHRFQLENGELHGRFIAPASTEPSGSTIYAHPITIRVNQPDGVEATTVSGLPDLAILDSLPDIGRIAAELEFSVRGGTPFTRPQEWVFNGWATHTTDQGCRYETWVVDSRFLDEETGVTIRRFYAPDLGLVVRIDHLDPGGKTITSLSFNSVTISG
jgi:hypothetical protein